jgi:hypothetical protein
MIKSTCGKEGTKHGKFKEIEIESLKFQKKSKKFAVILKTLKIYLKLESLSCTL